jgi:ATP-dependent DNA helicase RecG
LRKKGLIEGRKPNLHISDKIAKATDSKADYIKTRSQDDTFYAKLVLDYLEKFKKASRKDINILLFDKLSNALDDEQKTNKIGALLTKLRRNGKIWNAGSRTKPEWRIAERVKKECRKNLWRPSYDPGKPDHRMEEILAGRVPAPDQRVCQ